MLTSKERAKLKSVAQTIPAILQIGKAGIGEQLVKQVNDALEARELIKLSVLETAPAEPSEAAQELMRAVPCEVVQVIGRKVILWRRNQKKPVIEL